VGKKLPVIVGPTGIGKTEVAIEVAKIVNGEIVVCDSRQIYKKMNIGTAKPTLEQQKEIKHWLVDIVEPDEEMNAWEYAKLGRKVIQEIWRRGKIPLVVAGAGLYLKALVEGFFEIKERDKKVREELNKFSTEELYNMLKEIDPERQNMVHPNDRVRIIRAIEVYKMSGEKMSKLMKKKEKGEKWCIPLYLGLKIELKKLYQKMDERVEKMFTTGLVKEVEELIKNYSPTLNSFQTIGYKEVISYLSGEISLNEAKRLVKKNTHNYARRQINWFKKLKQVIWFNVEEENLIAKLQKKITNVCG
jgi:tRNA dimethylallyltransferase